MRIFSDLFRSLYRLTGVSFFNDIANGIYKVETTKREVDNVNRDVNRAKDKMNKDKDAS